MSPKHLEHLAYHRAHMYLEASAHNRRTLNVDLAQASLPRHHEALIQRLYRFRWLIYELVIRDLKLRYRGSALGFMWTLLNPLLFMGVYTLVFGVYLKVGIADFPLYLLSGLLPWNWFANALQTGTSAIVDGRMYVGKTVFPTEALLVVPVLSNLVNFLLSLPVFVVLSIVLHGHLGFALIALPLVIILQSIIVFSVVTLFATFNVLYRDVQQLVAYFVMLSFYLTPIFYATKSIPDAIRPFAQINPMVSLITSYQHILFANTLPAWGDLAYLAFTGLVLFGIAQMAYNHYRDSFGEYL